MREWECQVRYCVYQDEACNAHFRIVFRRDHPYGRRLSSIEGMSNVDVFIKGYCVTPSMVLGLPGRFLLVNRVGASYGVGGAECQELICVSKEYMRHRLKFCAGMSKLIVSIKGIHETPVRTPCS